MFARYCTSCPCVEGCRAAFGAYWFDKSANGVGCDKPFDGKGRVFAPPPAHRKGMTPDEEWAWFEEYLRRLAIDRERFADWSPRELEMAVMIKYPGRFKRRFT